MCVRGMDMRGQLAGVDSAFQHMGPGTERRPSGLLGEGLYAPSHIKAPVLLMNITFTVYEMCFFNNEFCIEVSFIV